MSWLGWFVEGSMDSAVECNSAILSDSLALP